MPDAHEAAVEAMAKAIATAKILRTSSYEQAQAALAALVRSEAVRAALKSKLPINAGTDAILAALAPPMTPTTERK